MTTEWGPGPWQGEPDQLDWVDERTSLACAIRRGFGGILCGYVGVPPTHPFFGWDYGDNIVLQPGDLDSTIDDVGAIELFLYAARDGAERGTIPLGMTLKVHQGITWSGKLPFADKDKDAGLWWFGFDCGHAGDLTPMFAREGPIPFGRYRDIDFVRKEVAALAFQLRQMETRALVDDGVLKFLTAAKPDEGR